MKMLGVVEHDGSISVDYAGALRTATDEYGAFNGYIQVVNGISLMYFKPNEVVRVNLPSVDK